MVEKQLELMDPSYHHLGPSLCHPNAMLYVRLPSNSVSVRVAAAAIRKRGINVKKGATAMRNNPGLPFLRAVRQNPGPFMKNKPQWTEVEMGHHRKTTIMQGPLSYNPNNEAANWFETSDQAPFLLSRRMPGTNSRSSLGPELPESPFGRRSRVANPAIGTHA